MKIALAQFNPVVGALEQNAARIGELMTQARSLGADLVIFPEMALTGYPPRDLLLSGEFIGAAERVLREVILPRVQGLGVILGTVVLEGENLYNSALLLEEGQITFRQDKTLLPAYDVFDEIRYFKPAGARRTVDFRGAKLALTICEDIWNDKDFWGRRSYEVDPVNELAQENPALIINISASPYHLGKHGFRLAMVGELARKYAIPVIYINQVGGNDDLIFDGSSFVVGPHGQRVIQAPSFQEDLVLVDTGALAALPPLPPTVEDMEWVYQALILGLKDYMAKTGFQRVVLGLSGGIDSALTAVLAARALGPDKVLGVALPSPYSSQHSLDDARRLAENLGIEYRVIPIHPYFQTFLQHLNAGELAQDLAEENLQARIRANILMFLSNRENRLLLTTGNKSELAVGYCTLYGDMCGGLAVISDVPKTMVYELARHINREGEIIPESSLTKPPSAELRPDQKDQDSLPPYEILDAILQAYIEENRSVAEMVAMGLDRNTVEWVIRRVQGAEYKRRQAALGLRVTSKAFGPGRRMPTAQGWFAGKA